MNKLFKVLVMIGILASVLVSLRYAYGQALNENQTQQALENSRQSTLFIKRYGSILQACADNILSGDNKLMLPCDRVIKNFDNHMEKLFNESYAEVAKILLGY